MEFHTTVLAGSAADFPAVPDSRQPAPVVATADASSNDPAMELLMKFASALPALLGLALFVTAADAAETTTIRIGVQKYGSLVITEEQKTLEKRLAPSGVTVEWKEFPAGPQLLEAMSVGSIDFGTTGEAPPVFAQAAQTPLLYVGVEPAAPLGEAIIVPKDSPIQSVADLKGKRVVLNKGANVHYLLVQALAAAGLGPKDIQPVYLPPADARAAFERGSVDAWAIWDPFLTAAQAATGARVVTDATGLAPNHQYFLARRDFTAAHPQLVNDVLDEINKTDQWAAVHQHEVALLLAPRTGLTVPVLDIALSRLGYGVTRLDDETIQGQQRIADSFFQLGLIPKPVTVRDAVWIPNS
jgi:sulfonate transport system substrate-binding protein